jgi:hypothetical protein
VPDDGHVARAHEAPRGTGAIGAQRQKIVGSGDCGHVVTRHQLERGDLARLTRISGCGHPGVCDADPQILHGRNKTGAAQGSSREILRPGQMSYAAVPQRGEMADGENHAGGIVRHDRGRTLALLRAIDEHGRRSRREAGAQHRIVLARGRQDQPVHAALHQFLDEPHLFRLALPGIDEQRGISASRQCALDAAKNGAEHGIGDVGHDDADQSRPTGAQARGQRVAPVTQPPRGLHDAPRHIARHQMPGRRIERPRGRRAMHARGIGHSLEIGRDARVVGQDKGPWAWAHHKPTG